MTAEHCPKAERCRQFKGNGKCTDLNCASWVNGVCITIRKRPLEPPKKWIDDTATIIRKKHNWGKRKDRIEQAKCIIGAVLVWNQLNQLERRRIIIEYEEKGG